MDKMRSTSCHSELGSALKDSFSSHEVWSSVYWFTGIYEFHAEETRGFPSQVNSQQAKMALLHDEMMKILRPVVDAVFASFEVDGVIKGDGVASPVLCLTAVTYFKESTCGV